LNTGSLFYATLNALAYFYMVCQAPTVQLYLMECVTPPSVLGFLKPCTCYNT
jgi:hypothetical protein